jgi:hypothetical protein
MPNTYTLLETITVGAAGASSVTFNSIPQTGYTDLVIHASMRDDSTGSNANGNATIVFNGDTANGTYRELFGTGSAAGSGTDTKVKVNYQTASGSGSTASTFGSAQIYIPNYRNANFKSVSTEGVAESNTAGMFMTMGASLWSSTAAITSIKINPGNGNFVQYSTFSLYGVSALGVTPTKAPKATGGSIIQTDGTYWYHAFLSSGTFTPATGLSCDVLVVGGGGAGGVSFGAGGGAGGVFYATSQAVTTAQTVTIGAGGVTPSVAPSVNGNDSTFGSLTAGKGGGGGGVNATAGNAGGSGGGGGGFTPAAGGASNQSSTGGTGYGNAGSTSNSTAAGGGGGAGAAAAAPVGTVGGAGGAGTSLFSAWGSVTGTGKNVGGTYYFAGGGTGNGTGGGATPGNGGTAVNVSGTPNTGAGAGGDNPGTTGGSGIVIVRYLAA